MARFLVHRHETGRRHFDLRLVQGDLVRTWSILKEPPQREGERRLAIERESMTAFEISRPSIEEEAFGAGMAKTWDEGEVTIISSAPGRLEMQLSGDKLAGRYELRRMRWYPGNRWLMEKTGATDANLT